MGFTQNPEAPLDPPLSLMSKTSKVPEKSCFPRFSSYKIIRGQNVHCHELGPGQTQIRTHMLQTKTEGQ